MIGASSRRIGRFFPVGVVCALGASVFGQEAVERGAATDADWLVVARDQVLDMEAYPSSSRAVGRMWVGELPLTKLTGYASGLGTVAQSSVPAAIFRSESCGWVSWVPGDVSYLHQMIFYNNKPLTPLRSYTVPVCYDLCRLGSRCVGQGGDEDCDCLAADDFPLTAEFQIYDGDPCGAGLPIAGTQVTIPITEAEIPPETIGDGTLKCFDLTAVVDPKVEVPEEVWLEAAFGHDDAWPRFGRPRSFDGQGDGGLAGIDDGVECTTYCYKGDPILCSVSGTCLSVIPSADANADVIFSLQPVPPPAETVHAETYSYRIKGNEAILERGGEPVWFDVRVSDFDPKRTGVEISWWRVDLDAAGFSSGTRGTLRPRHLECSPLEEDICPGQFGRGSECARGPFFCPPAFVGVERPDYIFFGVEGPHLSAAEDPFYFWSDRTESPVSSTRSDYYLGTIALDVPVQAKGTFTLELVPPPVPHLLDAENNLVPLVAVAAGKLTVETGRCCVAFGDDCVDGLTLDECEALGGVLAVNQSCESAACPTLGACCDSLAPGGVCAENAAKAVCTGEHLTWFERTPCSAVTCDETTGACCVDGVCTNDVAQSACPNDVWFKGLPCDDPVVAEACELKGRVPAASTWGLVVLGLGLLVGARVHFRNRRLNT